MENSTVINDLKLRVGYGITGTPPQSLFLGVARSAIAALRCLMADGFLTWCQSSNPNPNLRWEEKAETNLGLDFSLYKAESVDHLMPTAGK